MKNHAFYMATALALASTNLAFAEKSADFFPTYQNYSPEAKAFLDKIEPKTTAIDLPNGVHLDLKGKFYFLDKKDAVAVLTEAWNNPPSTAEDTIGMIFPLKYDPIQENNWGIELRWDQLGHVDDVDAATIDYDDLLRSMQEDTAAGNEQRKKDGFDPITLIGWAQSPTYDFVNKRLHWARELQFGDSADRTLNYDVRFLGRKGVFVMGYIAAMNQLPEVKQSLDDVLGTVSFNPGNKYSDFVPGVDTVAAVGVGGLIAGQLAAKAGILAVIILALKKFFVLLLLPFVWIWRKIRGGKNTA